MVSNPNLGGPDLCYSASPEAGPPHPEPCAWLLVQAQLRSGTRQFHLDALPLLLFLAVSHLSLLLLLSEVISWINMVNMSQEVMRSNERQMDTREERAETKWR